MARTRRTGALADTTKSNLYTADRAFMNLLSGRDEGYELSDDQIVYVIHTILKDLGEDEMPRIIFGRSSAHAYGSAGRLLFPASYNNHATHHRNIETIIHEAAHCLIIRQSLKTGKLVPHHGYEYASLLGELLVAYTSLTWEEIEQVYTACGVSWERPNLGFTASKLDLQQETEEWDDSVPQEVLNEAIILSQRKHAANQMGDKQTAKKIRAKLRKILNKYPCIGRKIRYTG